MEGFKFIKSLDRCQEENRKYKQAANSRDKPLVRNPNKKDEIRFKDYIHGIVEEKVSHHFIPSPARLMGVQKQIALAHRDAMAYMDEHIKLDVPYCDRAHPFLRDDHCYDGACMFHSIIIAHHEMRPTPHCTSFVIVNWKTSIITDTGEVEPLTKRVVLPISVSREFIEGKFNNWHIECSAGIPHLDFGEIMQIAVPKCTPEYFARMAKTYYPTCKNCHRTLLHRAFGATVEDETVEKIRAHIKRNKLDFLGVLEQCKSRGVLDYSKIDDFIRIILNPPVEEPVAPTRSNDAWD
jgi:hypothetical protein